MYNFSYKHLGVKIQRNLLCFVYRLFDKASTKISACKWTDYTFDSGGARKPAVAVNQQASRRHLILLCSTSFSRFTVPFCTPTETSLVALNYSRHQKAGVWKQICTNFPEETSPMAMGYPLPLREGIPHRASTTSTAFHVAQAPHCWSADHRAPYRSLWCPTCARTSSWRRHWLLNRSHRQFDRFLHNTEVSQTDGRTGGLS